MSASSRHERRVAALRPSPAVRVPCPRAGRGSGPFAPSRRAGVSDRRLEHPIAFPLVLVTRLDRPLLLRQHRDPRGEVGQRACRRGSSPAGPRARSRCRRPTSCARARSRGRSSRRRGPLPDTCMPSRMYLSPTGVRTTWPPAASTAVCSPPFDRTDTTSPPPGSASRSRRSRARMPSTWSPSTTLPARIHRDQAVGIAIEREADVGAAFDDGPGERGGSGRAAVGR